VLAVLTQVPNIGEIICIDDASTDQTAQFLQEHFPDVHLIVHPTNQGKAWAIRTGLEISSYDNIFLCDADLEGLVKKEIEEAIEVFFEKKADMVILKRENAPIHIKAFRGHILISGMRVIRKNDLELAIEDTKKWFALEVAINKYMMEKEKKCLRTPSSMHNTIKAKKYGLIQWLYKDLEMYYDMDLIENKFLQQIIAFHIEAGIDKPWIMEKLIQRFKLIDE